MENQESKGLSKNKIWIGIFLFVTVITNPGQLQGFMEKSYTNLLFFSFGEGVSASSTVVSKLNYGNEANNGSFDSTSEITNVYYVGILNNFIVKINQQKTINSVKQDPIVNYKIISN